MRGGALRWVTKQEEEQRRVLWGVDMSCLWDT